MIPASSGRSVALTSPLESVELSQGHRGLEAIASIVGDGRVWCFGEAIHGAHEFLALRNRLFAFAVERLGFTAIAVETHHEEATIVDDFVLGRRDLTDEVARAVFTANAALAWSDSAFEENVELIRWIRAFNDRTSTQRPVRFYGIDEAWPTTAQPGSDHPSPAGSERDATMADLVLRALKEDGASGRIFVFAGEQHVHRAAWTFEDPTWRNYLSMVEHLDAMIGKEMVVMGSVFDHGTHAGVGHKMVVKPPADASSVAGALARLGPAPFVSDLSKGLSDDLGLAALSRSSPMRKTSGEDEPRLCATDSFDALVYVDEISPVRPTTEWSR